MKKITALILALTLVLSLSACGNKTNPGSVTTPDPSAPNSAETMKWSMGHTFADGSLMDTYADKFAKRVYDETNGRIDITVYTSSQLGNAAEQLEQCGLGSIEIGWGDFSSSSSVSNLFNMCSLPFLFQGYDEVKTFLKSDECQKLKDLYVADGNVRQLGNWIIGPRHFSFPAKYTTYNELNNIKTRSPEIDVYIKTYEAFGMSPVTVAWSEIYSALQSGLVNAADANLDSIVSQQWYVVNPYVMMTAWCYQIGGPIINEDLWQSLDSETQEILTRIGDEIAAEQFDAFVADEQAKADELRADGVTVYDFYEEFEDAQLVIDNCRDQVWPSQMKTDEQKDFVNAVQALYGRQ